MCVIMVQPIGKKLPADVLRSGWDANPDGAGVAYVKDGKVVIDKGHMTLDSFIKAYDSINVATTPAVVHFRIRTHGLLDEERTHPFYVGNSGAALAHNGVLACVPYDATLSDTQLFLAKYPRLFDTQERLDSVSAQLGKYIGYNKFAVIYPSTRISIINAGLGKWDDGFWYSNSYWRPRSYK